MKEAVQVEELRESRNSTAHPMMLAVVVDVYWCV